MVRQNRTERRWVPRQEGGHGSGRHQGHGGHYQGHGGLGPHHQGGGTPVYQGRGRPVPHHPGGGPPGPGAPWPKGGGMPHQYYGGHRGGSVGRNVPPGPSRTVPELHQASYVQNQAPVVSPSRAGGSGDNNKKNKKNKKKEEEEPPANSPMNNRLMVTSNDGGVSGKNDMEKKAFLSSFNAVTVILPSVCLAFMIFSIGYPLTAKSQLSLGDPWMLVITGGFIIVLVASIILACLASRLKGRGSIEGDAFHIFKWLLLLVSIFLNTVIWISLSFGAKMSDLFVWLLYAIIDLAILSVWRWYFYYEHPKILEGCMEKDSVGEDGPAYCDNV